MKPHFQWQLLLRLFGVLGLAWFSPASSLPSLNIRPALVNEVVISGTNAGEGTTFYLQISEDLENWSTIAGPLRSPYVLTNRMADQTYYRLIEAIPKAISPFGTQIFGNQLSLQDGYLLGQDGRLISVPGSTLPLRLNATNYIGIDLFDQSLHSYSRNLDMGTFYLKQVICDNLGVVQVIDTSDSLGIPPSRIETLKQRLFDDDSALKILVLGDSLSFPFATGLTDWVAVLFQARAYDPTAFLSHHSSWQVSNLASENQTALDARAILGRSVGAPVNDSTGSTGFSSTLPNSTFSILEDTDIQGFTLLNSTDLLMIGYQQNTTSNLSHLERVVQAAREQGVAVVLHTGEGDDRLNDANNSSEGPILRLIADQHGAMLIDTWARMQEATDLLSLRPKADGLHQNDLGHRLWARWMRAAIPRFRQPIESIPASATMVHPPPYSDERTFPKVTEIELNFPSQGSHSVPYLPESGSHPNFTLCGRPMTNFLAIGPGGSATFSNAHAQSFDLVVDGGSSFSSVIYCRGIPVRTNSWTGTSHHLAIDQVLNWNDLQNLPSALLPFGKPDFSLSLSLEVVVISGNMVVAGGMWGVPEYHDLTLQDVSYRGDDWVVSASGVVSGTQISKALSSGSSFSLSFENPGVGFLFQGNRGGGRAQVTLDGTPFRVIDTYSPEYRFLSLNLYPTNMAPLAVGTKHVVTVETLKDKNIQAGRSSSDYPRLGLIAVSVYGSLPAADANAIISPATNGLSAWNSPDSIQAAVDAQQNIFSIQFSNLTARMGPGAISFANGQKLLFSGGGCRLVPISNELCCSELRYEKTSFALSFFGRRRGPPPGRGGNR